MYDYHVEHLLSNTRRLIALYLVHRSVDTYTAYIGLFVYRSLHAQTDARNTPTYMCTSTFVRRVFRRHPFHSDHKLDIYKSLTGFNLKLFSCSKRPVTVVDVSDTIKAFREKVNPTPSPSPPPCLLQIPGFLTPEECTVIKDLALWQMVINKYMYGSCMYTSM